MRRLSWIIWIGLNCNHKYPYKRERGRLDFRRQYDGGSRGWYKKNMEEGATNQGMQEALRSQTKLEISTVTENSENL